MEREGKNAAVLRCQCTVTVAFVHSRQRGGIAVAFACVGITLLLGWKKEEIFEKGILLGAGTAFLMPVMAALIWLCQSKRPCPETAGFMSWSHGGDGFLQGQCFCCFTAYKRECPLKHRGCSEGAARY